MMQITTHSADETQALGITFCYKRVFTIGIQNNTKIIDDGITITFHNINNFRYNLI